MGYYFWTNAVIAFLACKSITSCTLRDSFDNSPNYALA
jgi:hypothetical protein